MLRAIIKYLQTLLFVLFCFSNLLAQQLVVKGKIINKANGVSLSFANVRVKGTMLGTSANSLGSFQIKLKPGTYSLIASYIGYKSDTVKIKLSNNKVINFNLIRISIKLPEVTVQPGVNPAVKIIKKAIVSKHKRDSLLNSYTFEAYTKGIIKTTKDFNVSNSSVGISIGRDTSKLKVTGIIENESRGYFKKPNYYKDEIIARRQTVNTPSTINVVTGGRLIQNFYNDDLRFFNNPIPGPIADNALNYYYYLVEDTLYQDNLKVYQLYFAPLDASDPGFYGRIYIADSIFALMKVDVNLNDAANPGRIFNRIHIFQQFLPYKNNIYMPVDYRVSIEGNYLGLAKFGFGLNSILYDYKINPEIYDDFFDMAIVTVLPDADSRDSLYWKNTQTLPYTKQELEAYKRIDSLARKPKSFGDKFSFLSSRVNLNENVSFTGPLSLYSFNKVEGHRINLGFYTKDLFNRRLDTKTLAAYGFSDKKIKYKLYAKYLLGNYRTSSVDINVFNKVKVLFGSSDNYNRLTSTILSLFSKYDFRDYFYRKGFEINIASEVLPFLKLNLGFSNKTDKSAVNNSDFSFFYKSRNYRPNRQIYETKINAFNFGFRLDFRKYIENGYTRRRISDGSYAVAAGGITVSDKDILKSDLNFTKFNLNIYGFLRTFKSASLSFDINGVYSNGTVPLQRLYALPGNIRGSGKSYSFRTLRFGEVYGDQVATIFINHNFNDELFKILKIPVLKDAQLRLNTYINVAWLNISNNSKPLLSTGFKTFKHPFVEAGFSIGHILFPITFEFTWKLNYRGANNFVFGINTFAL